jgi:putative intracellular protease/amidase
MSATINHLSSKPRRVLLVVASPALSTTLNVQVGDWASELTHPYHELTERGFEVDIASPKGGKDQARVLRLRGRVHRCRKTN